MKRALLLIICLLQSLSRAQADDPISGTPSALQEPLPFPEQPLLCLESPFDIPATLPNVGPASPAFFLLPEIPSEPPEPQIQQVQYPFLESGAQNMDPGVTSLGTDPDLQPPPASNGDDALPRIDAWQEGITSFTYTAIPASSENVSWNTFDLRHQVQSTRFKWLTYTPRFAWQLVQNDPVVIGGSPPVNLTDIPQELYDFAVDATVHFTFKERFEFVGSVAPSMFSDFENVSSQAFRLPSRAVLFYQLSPLIKIGGGFLYLDRDDISAAAVAGVSIGRADDDLRLELFYPRAKISYRFAQQGDVEHFIYVAQDSLGGGSWAMQHSYGLDDVVTYRDQKVMLGYERLLAGQRAAFIEAGYVYDRRLTFSELGWGDLKSTGMVRVGFIF